MTFFEKKTHFFAPKKMLIYLPDWIYLKKGIVNPRCEEKDSFKYSVMMHLFPHEKHTERVSKKNEKRSRKLEIFKFFE